MIHATGMGLTLMRLVEFALIVAGAVGMNAQMGIKAVAAEPGAVAVNSRQLASEIDGIVTAKCLQNSVVVAERCSDAEFVRRVYLDLLGRIPRVAEVRRFLDDIDANKREALIDVLLDRPAFAAYFASVLRGGLMPRTRENPELYHLGLSLEDWLRPRIQQRLGYDQIVRELLTVPLGEQDPDGSLAEDASQNFGAVAWYQINDLKAENLAGAASRQLLGLKLECAQCHDHPFDQWSQDEFWQTAAFFSRLSIRSRDGQVEMKSGSVDGSSDIAKGEQLVSINLPHTDREIAAQFLGGDPLGHSTDDPRIALSKWLTAAENPYFAKATANRIWKEFFGRGIVDPVDDFRPDNPPSHPELLEKLTVALVENDFDLTTLIRAIMLSETYQRTSVVTDASQLTSEHFARVQERPMTAEQLWASLVVATGYHDPVPLTHRSLAGMDMQSDRIQFLTSFLGESQPDSPQISIVHSLKLLHGRFIDQLTRGDSGPMVTAISSSPLLDTEERIETLYMAALSRRPTSEERSIVAEHLRTASTSAQRAQAIGDVLWVLINSSEFMLNH